jgi:membrane protease YdiL (CAAX protease family)
MYQLTYLFVGALGVLCAMGAMRSNLDWLTRFLAALLASVIWGVWAVESFAVEVVTNGSVVEQQYTALAALGLVISVLMGLVTVQYGLQALQTSGETPSGSLEEMQP